MPSKLLVGSVTVSECSTAQTSKQTHRLNSTSAHRDLRVHCTVVLMFKEEHCEESGQMIKSAAQEHAALLVRALGVALDLDHRARVLHLLLCARNDASNRPWLSPSETGCHGGLTAARTLAMAQT